MRVGITFGAYDPLHHGHIRLFQRARQQCDKLVVCVSDAQYILIRKGRAERFPLAERVASLKELRCVDEVWTQSLSQDKQALLRKTGAAVIFVGNDWTPETFGGEGLGVPVVYLDHTPNVRSTNLVTPRSQWPT
jgi:glycerol-3-phosphate cytidylyltransferase